MPPGFSGPYVGLSGIGAAGQIASGKVRALAVSSATRVSDYPDVPTMNESFPGAVGDAWFGISVPAKTPAPVVERLQTELVKAIGRPDVRAQLQQVGVHPMGLGSQEFEQFLRQESAKWAAVLKDVKITAE